MEDRELYRDVAENKAQIAALHEDVREIKASMHEMREHIIKPILAWQNRAIGIGVSMIAIGNLINDWIKELKDHVFK